MMQIGTFTCFMVGICHGAVKVKALNMAGEKMYKSLQPYVFRKIFIREF